MRLADVTLGDKYDLGKNRILATGTQAIVRMLLMQQARDRRIGKNTAGYVSGYRGSPLGSLDQQLWRAKEAIAAANIVFQPGVNEDIAATALWGTQQAEMRGEGRYDGVFGLWYGKGPGVDRSGDALKHANLAGTSPWGGVVALMGDDHTCESSTTAHQSEFAFVDAMIPVLSPAGVQELIDYGLFGYALSRFAGVWVGLKCVKDTVESTATIDGSLDRVATVWPKGYRLPTGGLNIRPSDRPLAQEERLHEHKLPAALAFLRVNAPDRLILGGGKRPRIGIAAHGKSYLDVLQALDELGIDEAAAANLGLRLFKVACTWPLEPGAVRSFAADLETVIVVEEKRALVESQMKEILYGTANAPVVVGKKDETGGWLFPSKGALDPNQVAIAVGERIVARMPDQALGRRVAAIKAAEARLASGPDIATRGYYFCPGCPYNTGTVVPEGSRAYAGIGCHYMVQRMDRATEGYTQMGGEGANWIGEAPFSSRGHVFQNIGDGTYNHSGSLTIRAAAISGVNVTYKVFYNDAVALTGGQPVDGGLTVPQIAAQVMAEGAKRVVVVAEEPHRFRGMKWPAGVTLRHRRHLDAVQKQLAGVGGLSVLIYDQTCAAEKRRRRKRGEAPDPDTKVVINELVCEGCGDCGVQSNCVAIVPVETEFGRKRAIDQSGCNVDLSCLKGFCPSFVTVHGAKPRERPALADKPLPEPAKQVLDRDFAILIAGVGGTGVTTVAAILAMAAHLEGKGAGVIDMAGLAQKGGPVTSHIRIAPTPFDISAIRVAAGGADLVLACDTVVAASGRSLAAIDPVRTALFVNAHETLPGEFTRDPDFTLPTRRLVQALTGAAGAGRTRVADTTGLATALLGNAIATNMLMVGLAFQAGAVPLTAKAILRAIELNGVDVAMNQAAFAWGRRAAIAPDEVAAIAAAASGRATPPAAIDIDAVIDRRTAFLANYQDADYAGRYRALVDKVRRAESETTPGFSDLSHAVAVNLFRLMAVKDEYEVARLFTDGSFERQLKAEFGGFDRIDFHLAPPLFARTDPATGRPAKSRFGPWVKPLFRLLVRMRGIRGRAFDPFRYSGERRLERRLLAEYERDVADILAVLTARKHSAAVALARAPEKIRGFGPVKAAAAEKAAAETAVRREALLAPAGPLAAAAE